VCTIGASYRRPRLSTHEGQEKKGVWRRFYGARLIPISHALRGSRAAEGRHNT
jgi:hypothetical protein